MSTSLRYLEVLVDGLHVANIERRHRNDLRCRYTDEALARWPLNTPVLSCSLPLGRKPLPADAFCRGLLAEGRALQAMASRAGLATNDTFGLLEHYGRDVAGALSLVAEGRRGTTSEAAIPYSDSDLSQAIDDLPDNPLGIGDDSELSLAGLQDKLLLIRTADGWARPIGGAPSTHILKVDDPRFPRLVSFEHACLVLARSAGLPAAESSLAASGDRTCLIVTRFDRRITAEGAIQRIHQEDLCQALAIDPDGARGRAKYEAAGGPGLKAVARLLDRFAERPATALTALAEFTVFTVLIGNADAHGKNVALLHEPLGNTRLAPMYDPVPTVLWPKLRTRPAMSIGGCLDIRQVTGEHLVNEISGWDAGEIDPSRLVADVCGRVRSALASIDALGDFGALVEQVSSASDRVLGRL